MIMTRPNPRVQRTRVARSARPASPLTRHPLGRREVALLVLCALSVGCSERLTSSRAATIIRHSNAFLSGPPESQPVFDGVSALLVGTAGWTPNRQEADSYIAEFSYHWPEGPRAGTTLQPIPKLTARVVLGRSGNGWAVDDNRTRALIPSWPRLPKTPSPIWPTIPAP